MEEDRGGKEQDKEMLGSNFIKSHQSDQLELPNRANSAGRILLSNDRPSLSVNPGFLNDPEPLDYSN